MRVFYKSTTNLHYDKDGNGYFMEGENKWKLSEFMRITEAPEPYSEYHGVASVSNNSSMLVKIDNDNDEVTYALVGASAQADE